METRNNWQIKDELEARRYVRVRDDAMTYCAEITNRQSLLDACKHFSDTYDHNGEGGYVTCRAVLVVDGEDEEATEFEA